MIRQLLKWTLVFAAKGKAPASIFASPLLFSSAVFIPISGIGGL